MSEVLKRVGRRTSSMSAPVMDFYSVQEESVSNISFNPFADDEEEEEEETAVQQLVLEPELEPVEEPEIVKEPEPVKEPEREPEPEPVKELEVSLHSFTSTESIVQCLETVAERFKDKNAGVFSEDVLITYSSESVQKVKVDENGFILLPNYRVFVNGTISEWDFGNEARLRPSDSIELDLGVKFTLPDNYALEISGVPELKSKFDMELLDNGKVFSRQELMYPLVVRMRACDELSYLQKYKGVILGRVVSI